MRTSHLVGALATVVALALGVAFWASKNAERDFVPMGTNKQPATDTKTAPSTNPKPTTPITPANARPSSSPAPTESTVAPARRPATEPPVTNITRPNDNATPVFTPPPASAPAAVPTSNTVPFPSLTSRPTATPPVEPGNLPPVAAGTGTPSGTATTRPTTPSGSPAVTPSHSEPPARSSVASTPPATTGGADSGTARAPERRTEPAAPAPATPTSEKRTHKIQSGDTLTKLAKQYLGDEKRWRKIKDANPGLDENRLLIGQELVIPAAAATPANRGTPAATPDRTARGTNTPVTSVPNKPTEAVPAAAPATHKVGAGDTLIQIARNVFKDENRWREIFELNRDQLKSADSLRVGMVLKLPKAKATAAPSRPSGTNGNGNRSRRP